MQKTRYTFFITIFCIGNILSQTTITNNPATRYQTMKGWGTSLSWWANIVGGMPQATIDDVSTRVAVDIGLNFYRFNIGGGDNPNCPYGDHLRKDGGNMPSYRSYYANNQGFGVVNVSNDARQIAVMNKLATLRAPYGDVVTEMFSVGPPYYMTVSNCVSGAVSASNENLAPGFEDDFADYLCSVTKTLRDAHPNWNIQSIEPFNEPYSNFWAAGGGQEGCKMLANQQASVLYNVWAKQQTYGIGDIALVASDNNSISEARQNAYDLWVNHNNEYNGLSAIATHSYFGTAQEKASLYSEVSSTGKPVWQTETGPLEWYLPDGGQWWWRHYDVAQRMVEDIRNLKSEVWCNWQAFGADDAWSLVHQTNFDENDPFKTPTLRNTRSFYIYKQIANYIKVGYTQIANGDPNSMTFVSPDNKKIVVVIANNSTSSKDYSIDLSNFQTITYFDTYRTSGDDSSGENAKLLISPTNSQKGVLSANKIAYTAPAWSFTTFVASIETPVSVSLNDFETVVPNTVVRYGSDLSIVDNPLVNATNATAKTARLARTTTNWYELFAFNTDPITVPANTTYYLHAMVKYDAAADIAIRYDGTNRDTDGTTFFRALNPYTNAGQWQDLVFPISGGTTGVTVNAIQINPDLGFENIPAVRVLNNSTSFAYIDEFLISTSNTVRTAVAAPTLATTLANFDEINTTVTTTNGASHTVVANPYPNGGNTSVNSARIGRTSQNWNELTKFNIPDFALSAGETKYIHIAVNYPSLPVTSIRINVDNTSSPVGTVDILPVNAYASASNGHWQDLVFTVSGGAKGLAVNNLVILADVGNKTAPPTGQVLNNTTNYAYVDNIIINNSSTPLFTARTGLQSLILFVDSNTNPVPRLLDYTTAGVTGVTSANIEAVNAAIDLASSAPTNLVEVQALVNQALANLSVSVSVNDFETIVPNNVVRFGSDLSIVNNPLVNATNATAKTSRLARTTTNWYELFAFNIDPIAVPANTTYYLHSLVKYDTAADIAIRYDAANRDTEGVTPIRPLNPYTASDSGQWKDLVFAISGGNSGVTVNSIHFHPDLGFENNPTGQILNNSSSFAFIDELLVNGTSLARTAVVAPTLATTLANFDGITPVATTAYGASHAVVVNPYPNGGNTSANCAKIGRTSQNWYELTRFNIPDFALSAGETKYIHIAVNYPSLPLTSLRIDVDDSSSPAGQTDISAFNTYSSSSNGQWQDLVFAVSGGAKGLSVNNLVFVADVGNYAAPPAGQVLDNDTNYAYVDNIVINNSSTPLFTARTGIQTIALYAASNSSPTPRLVDYEAAGVTGVTAANIVIVNSAIDTASPAPTNLAAVQAIISPITALAKITSYSSLNTNPVPTLADYSAAGVTGVSSTNLAAVNLAIDIASTAPMTLVAVQAIVTPVIALSIITNYASSNTNTVPSLADYVSAGVTGVNVANLSTINTAIDIANPVPTTLAAIQALIYTQIPASPYAVCTGATVATATAGTTLKFYKDTKTTTAAYVGTQKLAAATYYVTEMVNGTESARVPVSVTLTALVAPTTIASTEAKVICKYMGTSNLVTFTTTPVVGASSYSWSVPAGATIEGNATGESITVSFEAVSGTPGLIGSVTVDSKNSLGCLSGKAKILALTTKAPTAPKTVVLTNGATVIKKAGNFVGDATKELTLTATDISGTADHHVWTLPAGTTVVTGDANNDLVLTVHLGNVTASNDALVFSCASVGGCGSSSKSLSIARAAAGTPKAITLTDALSATPTVGIKKLDAYTGSLKTRTLTLTATPNVTAGSEATSYTWVLPAAATVVDGTATAVEGQENTYTSTSASISVNLASVATETLFVFKVYGVNGNGTSLLSKDLTCTSAAPKAPVAIYSGSAGSGTLFTTYSPSCGSVILSVPAVTGVSNVFTTTTLGVSIGSVVGNSVTVDFTGAPNALKSTVAITATATTATGSASKVFTIKLGTACSGSKFVPEDVVDDDELSAIAYPNPSFSEFTIDVQSSSKGATNIQVYDMMGRLIENRQLNSNLIQVGKNYASGVYNVIVSQGKKVKTIKVIKK